MGLPSTHSPSRDPRDPQLHELEVLRLDGRTVSLVLALRRAEDGAWRGRLRFLEAEGGVERETAEIFCGATEDDIWRALQGLREHHVRDLYRSLA